MCVLVFYGGLHLGSWQNTLKSRDSYMPHFVMALTNKLLAHNFPATLSGGEGAMARMMHLTPL